MDACFQVEGLKSATQSALSSRLDKESAIPLLSLAERLGDSATILKDAAVAFIRTERYDLPDEDIELLSDGVKKK